MEKEVQKSSRHFGRNLGIYAAVLAAVAIIFLIFFWLYIREYQISRPQQVVEDFIKQKGDEYFRQLPAEYTDEILTEFETKEDAADGLAGLSSAEVQYYRFGENEYRISVGQKPILRVLLETGKKTRLFGFSIYGISDVSVCADEYRAQGNSVDIFVPNDAKAFLNGIELQDRYILKSRVEYADIGAFERKKAEKYLRCYRISGLFSEPEIKVVGEDGQVLEGQKSENRYVFSDLNLSARTLWIAAPKEAVISINGISVTEQYRSSDSVTSALYGEREDFVLWEIPGIYFSPAVEATDSSGAPMAVFASGDEYEVDYPATDTVPDRLKAMVTDYTRAYVNFVSFGFQNLDNNYSVACSYLVPGSDARHMLAAGYEGIRWNSPMTPKLSKLQADHFVKLSDNTYSAAVKYHGTLSGYGQTNEFGSTMRLLISFDNGQYRISRIVMTQE